MKKLFIAILSLCVLTSAAGLSQSKEKVLADIQKKNESYKTITSSCTQVKTMKGMKKSVESSGKMYFVRATEKLSMQLTHDRVKHKDKENQLIINGDKVTMISGGTRNVFNTKTDHNMNILKGTLISCIKGQIEKAAQLNKSDIKMTVNDKYYVFEMNIAKHAKGRWNHLTASYSKKDLTLCIFTLTEKNGNTTTWNTLEKEFNGVILDDQFNY
ncbi:MAG: outer membrane lipoprotein carrier protein LolA [Bacteroidales bacterium]|nr:outer membrane lipoprotein carrier protein LolA [Bacteroidales bacterium]